MSLKRIIALLLCFIMIFAFASCVKDGNEGTPDLTDGSETPTDTDAPATDAPITDAPSTDAPADETTAEPSAKPDLKKSLKILAVGNSFSADGMEYLYNIAKNAGIEEVILGNLYVGGCDLNTHYGYCMRDEAAYTYYKNTSGEWKIKNNFM